MTLTEVPDFYRITRSQKKNAKDIPNQDPAHIRFHELTEKTPRRTRATPKTPTAKPPPHKSSVKFIENIASPTKRQVADELGKLSLLSPNKICKVEPKPRSKKGSCLEASLEKYNKIKERKPASERLKYLVELPDSPLKSPIKSLLSPTKINPEVKTDSLSKISSKLPLPLNFVRLNDAFRHCETVISMLHNRHESCTMDKVQPAVERIIHRKFGEEDVEKIVEVYPSCYFLKYDKQVDRVTKKLTGSYTLTIEPCLRSDNTQIGVQSPMKGHLPFNGSRLLQRKQEFERRLYERVFSSHYDHLLSIGVKKSEIPKPEEIKRWHPSFKLDSLEVSVSLNRMPMSPAKMERRLTSAREAVNLFKARVLFKEANICEEIAKEADTIPVSDQLNVNDLFKDEEQVKPRISTPNVLLTPNKTKNKENTPISTKDLTGISKSLLAKVRAKEEKYKLLTIKKSTLSPARESVLSRIPEMVPQLWCILRATKSGKPMTFSQIAKGLSTSCRNGNLSMDSTLDHLKTLIDFAPPGWVELLNWTVPHLKLINEEMSIKDVLEHVNSRIQEERNSN